MATLITGGAGFIGLAIAEALMQRGESVLLFDRKAPPEPLLRLLRRGVLAPEVMTGDIRSREDVGRAVSRPDVDRIVHAAAITPDLQRETSDPLSVLDVNIGGTACLLHALATQRAAQLPCVRRVLVLSSIAIYGTGTPAGAPLDEATSTPAPLALYGISKLAAEQAALRLGALHGLDVRVARIGPVFGPWEHASGVRDALSPHLQVCSAALSGQPVVLPGPLRADWIYSRDAALALTALLRSEQLRHEVYNVGGEHMSDLPQWSRLVAAALPGGLQWHMASDEQPPTVRYGLPPGRAPMNNARLAQDAHWAPTHDLTAASADLLAWLHQLPATTLPAPEPHHAST